MACKSCGQSRASRAGNSVATAIVFGEPTDDVVRIRVTGELPGFQIGAIKYVRGSLLQDYYDAGTLVELSGPSRTVPLANQTVLYYVGDLGFTTIDAARVQSSVTGDDIVVVTVGE